LHNLLVGKGFGDASGMSDMGWTGGPAADKHIGDRKRGTG